MAEKEIQSPRKSEVAQTKARDPTTGRFLNPEQIQQAQAQAQQAAIQAQQQRLNTLFGKQTPTSPITPNIPSSQPQNNFQTILAANKPGGRSDLGMASPDSEEDKWNIMLGKKRSNIRW